MTDVRPLVDIHNHLIPAVDDGARSLDEALAALEAMHAQGIRRIVATPHLDAELTHRAEPFAARMAKVDAAWELLRDAAAERFPDVELGRGHEVMLDVPQLSLEDARVRLAGGRTVLVEFPRLFVPAGSSDALYRLRSAGWLPLVAHPERYLNVNLDTGDLSLVEEWRRIGARMIVNAGSVTGNFGPGALATVREMLRRGWVDLIGSDYHARPGRPLRMRHAYDQLVEWSGEEQAELLLAINPGRAIDGEEALPVPPLALSEPWWGRLRKIFSK
ncbi:MAG TPA: CpsB/CapC family capsule biosynthesis tyrosine phosphatase [Longimicrobiaceae bacterium]|nr:CpsB/CapC family capsule biosynthesis tyrosine phosphatase [Longimicrobiaceae bacterium]